MLTHLHPAPRPPRRVVILGARGFIAGALAAALRADGIEIYPVSSQEIDLSDATAAGRLSALLRADDAVVMTAAVTPDKGKDAATLMRNLRMGEQVARALAARPCGHFIYLSSDAVYDWRQPLVSEATPPSPTDLYSLMHLAREHLLAAAAQAAQVPFCVLRPCAVYGAGDTHNGYGPNRFLRAALADGVIRLFGAGEETRDHVAIRDVAALLLLALAHRSTGLLNVVSGVSISFGELARRVAVLGPRPVAVESLPRSPGPVTHRRFDPTALYRSFPLHRPTRLEIGLQETWRELTIGR
jgi:UDP-glucose 4-epimerase